MSFDGEHRSVVYGLMTGILGQAQWHRCAARQAEPLSGLGQAPLRRLIGDHLEGREVPEVLRQAQRWDVEAAEGARVAAEGSPNSWVLHGWRTGKSVAFCGPPRIPSDGTTRLNLWESMAIQEDHAGPTRQAPDQDPRDPTSFLEEDRAAFMPAFGNGNGNALPMLLILYLMPPPLQGRNRSDSAFGVPKRQAHR